MKRRDFLKLIALAAVAAKLPAPSVPTIVVPAPKAWASIAVQRGGARGAFARALQYEMDQFREIFLVYMNETFGPVPLTRRRKFSRLGMDKRQRRGFRRQMAA